MGISANRHELDAWKLVSLKADWTLASSTLVRIVPVLRGNENSDFDTVTNRMFFEQGHFGPLRLTWFIWSYELLQLGTDSVDLELCHRGESISGYQAGD